MTEPKPQYDVDRFIGFNPPTENWSKLPHQLIEALPKLGSLAELKVVLYVLRHTWGYQEYEEPKRITLNEFQYGRKSKKGRIDDGVGMSKPSIIEGLSRAIDDGFLICESDNNHPGRPAHCYRLSSKGKETLPSR